MAMTRCIDYFRCMRGGYSPSPFNACKSVCWLPFKVGSIWEELSSCMLGSQIEGRWLEIGAQVNSQVTASCLQFDWH